MLFKLILGVLALLAILWAAGFDFQGAKNSLIGMSQDNAQTATGDNVDDDWGS